MSEATPALVLVVDDDRLLLDGLRRQLHGTFDLATALGGHEGLDVLRAAGHVGGFAVVLSDYQMPRMDGASFLAAVRDVAPEVTRMLLEAFGVEARAVDAPVSRLADDAAPSCSTSSLTNPRS